ncbi:MAG: hypothetical protein IPJ78_02040 [Gemmatimonadetes bacterium]|jgi:hypothetical protein|nr:hypothetical protein [Gemmatimonadota bacterium]
MRRPVLIASILALLSACDKPQEQPASDVPAAPQTAVTPTSTILFQVFGAKDEPKLVPIVIADGGHLAPITLDANGWRLVDSLFFAKGKKLPIYRNGAESGTVEIVRGMWTDEGALYSLPACSAVVPQALGKLDAKGFVEASVEYLASTTPLKQPPAQRAVPTESEAPGRTLANTVAAAKQIGKEEIAALDFVSRWLPTGAGPSGRTLFASYIDPNGGDAGAGAGHTVMVMALAEDSAGVHTPSYQHVSSGEARTVDFQRLVNHADLDGDGIDEILLEEWRYAGIPEVAVLKYAQGKWRLVFRVSQNWCLDTKKPD